MRRQTALPRIAREGWVPAGPDKRISKRAMLIPKTGHVTDDIPRLMDFSEVICPAERRALREIIETAEVVKEGNHLVLVARVSAATLDSLATFETSREDLELEPDAEQVNEDLDDSDLDPDDDREFDFPRERQKYIKDRQEPGREHIWHGGRVVDPPTYDATKDEEELRKTKRQLSTLAAKKRKATLREDRKGATS